MPEITPTPAERRVINAAKKWRKVYMAWLTDSAEQERDLSKNGENQALSKLLDALQDLDRERSYAPSPVVSGEET